MLDLCALFWEMSVWPILYSSAAVFASACSAIPIHWALHARCQSERRGKQPLCFSLQRNKSTVSCRGTTGTTVCHEGDLTLQTATRSQMMGRQMPCWAKRILEFCHCHCLCVSLPLCTWVLMWQCHFKEDTENRATKPTVYILILLLIYSVISFQCGYKPSQSHSSWEVSSVRQRELLLAQYSLLNILWKELYIVTLSSASGKDETQSIKINQKGRNALCTSWTKIPSKFIS